jgi:hypothetical protein
VLSNGHAGCGGRVRETGRSKYRYRALARPYPSRSAKPPWCRGKPTARKAQSLGGNRTPKKQTPAAERQQENGSDMTGNWPDTGPGARLRKQADMWRVSP